MGKQIVLAGSSPNRRVKVLITDVNGNPITGLVYNSSGLAAKYFLDGAAGVAITLVTQTVTGAYSSGGFVEVDSTAAPGLYYFDIPNAAFGSGTSALISLYGYAGMAASLMEFDLWAANPQDGAAFGLSRLDAAISSRLAPAGTLATVTNLTNAPTVGDFTAAMKTSLGTAVGTAQTGDSFARLGAPAGVSIAADIAGVATSVWAAGTRTLTSFGSLVTSIWAAVVDSAGVTTLLGRLTATRAGNLDDLDAPVSSRSTFAGGAVASVTAGVTVTTNNDKSGYALSLAGVQAIWDALTSALTTVGSVGKWIVTSLSTYAGADTPGTTTLLARVPSAISLNGGAVTVGTNNDKAGYSLASGQLQIKKNTQLVGFTFPMFDSITHQLKTGATVTARRIQDGGAIATCDNAVAEVSNGAYTLTLSANDLNANTVMLILTASGCDDQAFTIVTQA